jgi:hypothetical protein
VLRSATALALASADGGEMDRIENGSDRREEQWLRSKRRDRMWSVGRARREGEARHITGDGGRRIRVLIEVSVLVIVELKPDSSVGPMR